METRDKLIIRQVAFKGAIEMLAKSLDSWNHDAIVQEVHSLTDEFEAILLKVV